VTVVNSADIARRSKASLYGQKLISFPLILWARLALQRARPCVSGEAPAPNTEGASSEPTRLLRGSRFIPWL
jgi:hypothetical protein